MSEVRFADEDRYSLRRPIAERVGVLAQVRIKGRMKAILHANLIPPYKGYLFGKAGQRWLDALPLLPEERRMLQHLIVELKCVSQQLSEIDNVVAQQVLDDPQALRLMTIPGVNSIVFLMRIILTVLFITSSYIVILPFPTAQAGNFMFGEQPGSDVIRIPSKKLPQMKSPSIDLLNNGLEERILERDVGRICYVFDSMLPFVRVRTAPVERFDIGDQKIIGTYKNGTTLKILELRSEYRNYWARVTNGWITAGLFRCTNRSASQQSNDLEMSPDRASLPETSQEKTSSQNLLSVYDTKLYIRNKFGEFAYHRDREISVNFPSQNVLELTFDIESNNSFRARQNGARTEVLQIDLAYLKEFNVIAFRDILYRYDNSYKHDYSLIEIICHDSCVSTKTGLKLKTIVIQYAVSPSLEAERIGRAIMRLAETYKHLRQSDPFD